MIDKPDQATQPTDASLPATEELHGLRSRSRGGLVALAVEDVQRAMTEPQTAGAWLPLQSGEGWYYQVRGVVYEGRPSYRRGGFIGVGSTPGAVLATAVGTSLLMRRKVVPQHTGTVMITNQRLYFQTPNFWLSAPLSSITKSASAGMRVLKVRARAVWFFRNTYKLKFPDLEKAWASKSWLDVATAKAQGKEREFAAYRLTEAHRLAAKGSDVAGQAAPILERMTSAFTRRYRQPLDSVPSTVGSLKVQPITRRRRHQAVTAVPALLSRSQRSS